MINRRKFMEVSAGMAVITMLPAGIAFATPEALQAELQKLTGGASVAEGGITLDMPEIAENGNTVPLTVSVDSPMTADSYVKSITIMVDGNPNPDVATFNFTPASGQASASTRIRLAKTQNIVALAQLSDGSFITTQATVKVTIGGCGG